MNRTEAEKRARAAIRAIAEYVDSLPENAAGLSVLSHITESLEETAAALVPGWEAQR